MHIAAAEWIMLLACSRGSGICAADKLLLLALWNHAPYDLRGPATGKQVYPSRRMLAEETGQTLDAVRDQLRRLLAAGWIRVDGDGWALAWVTPFEVEACMGDPSATAAQDPATLTAGHPERAGDSNRRTPATLTHPPATLTAGPGDSNRRPSEQEPTNTPTEHTTASASGPLVDSPPAHSPRPQPGGCHDQPSPSPPQIASSTPPVSESGDDPPSSPPPLVQEQPKPAGGAGAPQKRRSKPPAPEQGGLDLGDDGPRDAVAVAVLGLLADHRRLRREAQAANGLRETDLPAETSGAGVSLRKRLRRAVEVHGEEACRRALVFRAAEWRDDPGALERWSTDSMWSPKSLAVSIPAGARASPGGSRPARRSRGPGDDAECSPDVWRNIGLGSEANDG